MDIESDKNKTLPFNRPDQVLEELKKKDSINFVPTVHFETPQDSEIHFIVDEKISPAKFKPHPLLPHHYLANSLTLRALRKHVQFLGEDLHFTQTFKECKACHTMSDFQFWHMCPFCGGELSD
jgi:hypothetical protein